MDSTLRSSILAPRTQRTTSSASGATATNQDFSTLHSRTISYIEKDELMEEEEHDAINEAVARASGTVGVEDSEPTWNDFAKRLQKQDKETAKAWKEQIDALLVFAGLFSAILTAFNVDLYKSLIPDDVGVVHRSSVWINALWFTSLVLSLSSASVGIVIRQWIVYFLSPTPTSGRQDVYVHCLRWDQGIKAWRVQELLGLLPVLLQLALTLFFIGLVILLWTLNTKVAIVTTVFISILLAFLVFSTVAPLVSPYCPYKSPQALLLHSGAHLIAKVFRWTSGALSSCIGWVANAKPFEKTIVQGALQSLAALVDKPNRMRPALYSSWASLERSVVKPVDGKNPHHDVMNWIEDNVFARGHVLLMDEDLLSTVLNTCLKDFNEHVDEEHTNLYALKRLQCIFDLRNEQPLSSVMRKALAVQVLSLLPKGDFWSLQKSDQDLIWSMIPHILDGGDDAVIQTIKYVARQPVASRDSGPNLPSQHALNFVNACIEREGLRQVWNQGPPLEVIEHDFIEEMIEVIIHKVLAQGSDHPLARSLHNRINACGLAAFLARSLPPASIQKRLHDHTHTLLEHVNTLHSDAYHSHDDRLKILLCLSFRHLRFLLTAVEYNPQDLEHQTHQFERLLPTGKKLSVYERQLARLKPEPPK